MSSEIDEAMDRPWRVGSHWGVTIVSEGLGEPDDDGRRVGDALVGTAQARAFAERIVEDHNALLAANGYEP